MKHSTKSKVSEENEKIGLNKLTEFTRPLRNLVANLESSIMPIIHNSYDYGFFEHKAENVPVNLKKLSNKEALNNVQHRITNDLKLFRLISNDIDAALKNISDQYQLNSEDDEQLEVAAEILDYIAVTKNDIEVVSKLYANIVTVLSSGLLMNNFKESTFRLTNSNRVVQVQSDLLSKFRCWLTGIIYSSDVKEINQATVFVDLDAKNLGTVKELSGLLGNLMSGLEKLESEINEILAVRNYVKNHSSMTIKDIYGFFLQLIGSIVTPLGKPTLFGGYLVFLVFTAFTYGIYQQTNINIGQFQDWKSWLEILVQYPHLLVIASLLSTLTFVVVVWMEYKRYKNPISDKHFWLLRSDLLENKFQGSIGTKMVIKISIYCSLICLLTGYFSASFMDYYPVVQNSYDKKKEFNVMRLGNSYLQKLDDDEYVAYTQNGIEQLFNADYVTSMSSGVKNPQIDVLNENINDLKSELSNHQLETDSLIREKFQQLYSGISTIDQVRSIHINQPSNSTGPSIEHSVYIANSSEGIATRDLGVFNEPNDKELNLKDKFQITNVLMDFLRPSLACNNPSEPGWLRVSAFSDSSCFNGNCSYKSHYENLELANKRAEVVQNFIENEMFSDSFINELAENLPYVYNDDELNELKIFEPKIARNLKVTHHNWSSYLCKANSTSFNAKACKWERSYMHYKAGFNDRNGIREVAKSSDGFDEDKGELNRRVVISLMTIPKCNGEISFAQE